MATFIALIQETQQGEKNIKDSVDRSKRFQELASEYGVTVKGLYWTMGAFDGVLIIDAPDDETGAALLYRLTSQGAVRTQTLRAFDAEEMGAILERAGG